MGPRLALVCKKEPGEGPEDVAGRIEPPAVGCTKVEPQAAEVHRTVAEARRIVAEARRKAEAHIEEQPAVANRIVVAEESIAEEPVHRRRSGV